MSVGFACCSIFCRKAFYKVAAVLAIGMGVIPTSQAQTMAIALDQAWARHPQAATFGAREAEAHAKTELATALTPAPASLSLSNVSDRFNSKAGREAWELEVAMPMWLPGQRGARQREADGAMSEVNASQVALKLQLAGEVRAAWWALAAGRDAAALAQQREAQASALESEVLRRVKAGELAQLDANLARTERLAAQGELLQAQSSLRQAEQALRVLTGHDAPERLHEETPALAQSAPASHPQWVLAQSAAQLAQARLDVAQQTRRDAPELALRWVRERGDFGTPYANAVGVKLSIPFSSEARGRQDVSAARSAALQASAALALVQQRMELELARARLDLEVAEQQMAKAQERLALTADSLRLSEKSFALGEFDLQTLLRARSAAREAQAYLDRQRSARAASVSSLNQSMGVMP